MGKNKSYIDSKFRKVLLDDGLNPESKKELLALISEFNVLKEQVLEKLGGFDKRIGDAVKEEKEIVLPLSIFRNKLSTLEVVAAYLKDKTSLSIAEIAELLKRDHRTIWHAYSRAAKKGIKLSVKDSDITIPVSVFADRSLSPLESFVFYLKDSHHLSFKEIAALRERSAKTIWTVYKRARKKYAKK